MLKTRYDAPKKTFLPEYVGVTFKKVPYDVYETKFDGEIRDRIECCYAENNTEEIFINYRDPQKNLKFVFNEYDIEPETTSYCFFQINCEKDTEVVIVHWSTPYQKVWVNYKLCSYLGRSDIAYTTRLKKGLNTIVFEHPNATPNHTFFLRISSLEYEKNRDYLFFDDNMDHSGWLGYIYRENNFLVGEDKSYRFMFFPANDTLIPPNGKGSVKIYRMKLEGTEQIKELVLEDSVSPLTKCTYDLSKYEYDINSFTYFCLEFSFPLINGKTFSDNVDIFLYYPYKSMEDIFKQATEYVNSSKPTDYDRLCIKQYFDKLIMYKAESTRTLVNLRFYKRFQNLLKGKHFDDEICAPGFEEVLFYSKTFEELSSFYAYVPQNYDPNKKYPLVILTTTKFSTLTSKYFADYTAEDVIAVDVSLRGVNLASYVGDVALWEAVSEIKKCYSIDEDRIYITGYSNGGGASLVQAQLHPDQFAGIYPVGPGGVNKNMAVNLLNTKVIALSSPHDTKYMYYHFIEETLSKFHHPDFTGILIDDFSHITLLWIQLNKKIFEKLLEGRRNKYPKHIAFMTTRNRCRKAHWIEIHSIAYGKLYAGVEAILSENNIVMHLNNATGVTVTLPPELPRGSFTITINEQHFKFQNYTEDVVVFVNEKDGFSIKDSYEPIIDLHKGNGLLDVYLDPLVIAVPDNTAEESKLYKAAVNFSRPTTNGYDRKLYVSYPIKTFAEILNSDFLYEKSFIVFDKLNDTAFLNEIRQHAIIKCSKDGYAYMDQNYVGNYCIMQIVRSPWNPKRNIVLVSSNCQSTFDKNFFIRNVVLPTYANDYHPHWNNDALIFIGKEYQRVLEFGLSIENITQKG